jgi:hypothetical protein
MQDLGLFFALEFFLIVGFLGIGGLLFGEQGTFSHLPEGSINGMLYLLQTFVLLVPLYIFTQKIYGSTMKDFGLNKVKQGKLWKSVGLGFLIYYIVSSMIIQFKYSYQVQIPGYGEQESHIPLFGESMSGLVIGGLIIILVAPLVEELVFRGYIYQILKKRFDVVWGSVFAALIFSLFHLEFQVILPIFILGLVMNWIFERTQSLWAPIAFHMVNNALAFMLEIAVFNEWIELPPL